MAQPRWLAPWKDDPHSPAIYHVVNRVVDRRFAFGPEQKEKFKMFLRMAESFSGCQVLAYCVMSNHFHVLLEVPPKIRAIKLQDGREVTLDADARAQDARAKQLADELSPADLPQLEVGTVLEEQDFFQRLRVLYSDNIIKEIEQKLARAREAEHWEELVRIFERYTYRMQNLSEFMKNLTQRFTRWFNRTQDRTGRLWEERFKSVVVEGGAASLTIAAYIDLNPVRAGIVTDAAQYRWSSYGEAVAGGQKARAGLARAIDAERNQKLEPNRRKDQGGSKPIPVPLGARQWAQGGLGKKYRELLLMAGQEVTVEAKVVKKGTPKEEAKTELAALKSRENDLAISKVIQHRIRYFSEGVVIGGKDFVENFFKRSRVRFGSKRTSGARKPRGALSPLQNELYSVRDFQNP